MSNELRKLYENKCKEEVQKLFMDSVHELHRHIPVLKYVRKRYSPKTCPVGLAICFFDGEGVLRIGWSKCCPKDKWNKYIGIAKAISPEVSCELKKVFSVRHNLPLDKDFWHNIPKSMIEVVKSVARKANRIFNGSDGLTPKERVIRNEKAKKTKELV